MKYDHDTVTWKGEWQTAVPDRLFEAEMSGMAKLFWISLKRYVSRNSPNPFPGRHTLCKIMCIGVSSFKKYRRELEEAGWLERHDRRAGDGMFHGSIYTLLVPENCKQNIPPGVEIRSPVKQPPEKQPPVNQPPKEYPDQKETKIRRTTTTEGSAGAESGVGDSFLKRWKVAYREWFGSPYLQKNGEVKEAQKLIEELECRPKDLLAYAFRMWVNTTDFDEVLEGKRDPLWYQIKASRNLNFFFKYLSEIATEQNEPLDCAIPVEESEYQRLEGTIAQGRPA